MCAHRQLKRNIYPPSIFCLHFDSWHPPPFPQIHRGAAIEKNFFIFSDFIIVLVLIVDLILVLYLSDFDLEFTSSRLRFSTLIIIWDSVFSILYFDQFLLVIFPSYLFRLVSALSILCFDSSTLYLFNSYACYKQTFMLMQSLVYACFGYFKAFWRVFVCFRCSLSSWVKIMRQKA